MWKKEREAPKGAPTHEEEARYHNNPEDKYGAIGLCVDWRDGGVGDDVVWEV